MLQAEGWEGPGQQKLKASCLPIHLPSPPFKLPGATEAQKQTSLTWGWSLFSMKNINPETWPTGSGLIFLKLYIWGGLGPAVASPSKSNPIPGEWGEGSPPASVSEATLQTRDPKPLVWHVPERWASLSLLHCILALPIGSQLPIVELCSTTRTRWAKPRTGQWESKAPTPPRSHKHCSNPPLPFLTLSNLHTATPKVPGTSQKHNSTHFAKQVWGKTHQNLPNICTGEISCKHLQSCHQAA